MQTVIELSEVNLQRIDKLSETKNLSRDEVVAQAIECFAKPQMNPMRGRGFGILADMQEDSVDYQQRLRAEW